MPAPMGVFCWLTTEMIYLEVGEQVV